MTAMVMNRRALLLALGSTLALSGCLRPSFRTDQLDATGTGSIAARYTLAAGDKLRVIVFGQDNLSNIYAVDGGGRIAMPLIGTVQVGGQTTAQAAKAIEAKLASGFVREPHVTVEVDAYRPFYILGGSHHLRSVPVRERHDRGDGSGDRRWLWPPRGQGLCHPDP